MGIGGAVSRCQKVSRRKSRGKSGASCPSGGDGAYLIDRNQADFQLHRSWRETITVLYYLSTPPSGNWVKEVPPPALSLRENVPCLGSFWALWQSTHVVRVQSGAQGRRHRAQDAFRVHSSQFRVWNLIRPFQVSTFNPKSQTIDELSQSTRRL